MAKDRREYFREYHRANRQKRNEAARRYYAEHREEINAKARVRDKVAGIKHRLEKVRAGIARLEAERRSLAETLEAVEG